MIDLQRKDTRSTRARRPARNAVYCISAAPPALQPPAATGGLLAPEAELSGPPRPHGGGEIRPDTRLLVVAAHPDDDVLAAGGLLHRACSLGAEVTVAFATSGENNPWAQRASERRLFVSAADRPRFGARRRDEALAGLARLGVSEHRTRFLGLPDQGLTNLLLADTTATVATLRALLAEARPSLLVAPAAGDLHPDHSALAVLLRLAVAGLPAGVRPRELAYVVHNPALRHAVAPATTLTLSDHERADKLAAILCHATQLHLRGPWLRSFAAATESFSPVPTPAPHPLVARHAAVGAWEVAVATRPRARALGARTLLLLADRGDDCPRALACPLPAFPCGVALRDAASNAPLAAARFSGHAFGGTLALPADVLAGAARIFLKLERRVGFFDEAGWLEVRHRGLEA
jgi:LmbE family N-acetylglucosaminyl deacetylase